MTVNVLSNAMATNPSKHFLIEGFPRAIDQAQHFEQTVCEMQQLIYLEMPKEEMHARLLKRGEGSERIEDQPETCTKRIQNFFDQTIPVFEYYQNFGKLRTIEASGDVTDVYNKIKNAIMP